MTPPTLRLAGPATAGRLAAIHRESFAQGWSVNAIAGLLVKPPVFAYLAAGEAGFVMARAAAGEAEILTLAVAPRHRRRGVGRALMRAALAEAAARGADCVFLEVARDNAAALGLYRSLGFAEVGSRPGYYGPGEAPVAASMDALVLRCRTGAVGRNDPLQCATDETPRRGAYR